MDGTDLAHVEKLAGVIDLCSNNSEFPFTPDALRRLAAPGLPREVRSSPAEYRVHALSKRLGPKKVDEIVRRYRAGESARSIATHYNVAPSALVRLLRSRGVVVEKRRVGLDEEKAMARDYEAGATMAELEKKYKLSHGAVFRALHRVGVQMRVRGHRGVSERPTTAGFPSLGE